MEKDKRMGGKGKMHLNELKSKKIGELTHMARDLNVENASGLRKQELIFSILQAYVDKNESVYGEGVLEILSEGFGFLTVHRLELPPRSGRHICIAVPDKKIRTKNGRHDIRTDQAPQG